MREARLLVVDSGHLRSWLPVGAKPGPKCGTKGASLAPAEGLRAQLGLLPLRISSQWTAAPAASAPGANPALPAMACTAAWGLVQYNFYLIYLAPVKAMAQSSLVQCSPVRRVCLWPKAPNVPWLRVGKRRRLSRASNACGGRLCHGSWVASVMMGNLSGN